MQRGVNHHELKYMAIDKLKWELSTKEIIINKFDDFEISTNALRKVKPKEEIAEKEKKIKRKSNLP